MARGSSTRVYCAPSTLQENYSGDAQLVNSVYFDNDSLELYHGRLDKKPGAIALRVRCVLLSGFVFAGCSCIGLRT